MSDPIEIQVKAFLVRHPHDGEQRLAAFLQTEQLLYSTEDVMRMTGWSQGYITRLCRRKVLPHIPGNPHKFMLAPLKQALEDMLVGAGRGRKKNNKLEG